jgi:hypothetical protein
MNRDGDRASADAAMAAQHVRNRPAHVSPVQQSFENRPLYAKFTALEAMAPLTAILASAFNHKRPWDSASRVFVAVLKSGVAASVTISGRQRVWARRALFPNWALGYWARLDKCVRSPSCGIGQPCRCQGNATGDIPFRMSKTLGGFCRWCWRNGVFAAPETSPVT